MDPMHRPDNTGSHALPPPPPLPRAASERPGALLARSVLLPLVVTVIGAAATFWVSTEVSTAEIKQRTSIVERRLDTLEERWGTVEDMRGDTRALVVGFEAWRQRDAERSAEIERRLGRIENALDRRR